MALALRPPRVPKPKSSLLSHYHESFLEKKGPRDRDYKKFWAGLQGLTLYFYNSNRDSQVRMEMKAQELAHLGPRDQAEDVDGMSKTGGLRGHRPGAQTLSTVPPACGEARPRSVCEAHR
ncbi:signal-transducing adaptor protein 2-like isoform X1 [Physeter macrocephalus]|uniref:Signal-transducing adaptor protein 2-like isoform X1 n=1 Tax=Physeter macrocephalus TaxID=9755 RepID=A0A9W2WK20_PHYMC|nr:signal-transducing adaptor protein 2-like isoform X1 [Physeter catodon]